MAAGPDTRPHVAVVGGGISGLAAAWFVRRRLGERVRLTVLEGAPAVGGKLRSSELEGVPVDEGAESLLAVRPEAVALARGVGLGDDLVAPATTSAMIWTRGALRPLPPAQVMGIPTDLRALAATGVLSLRGMLRAGADLVLPRTRIGDDVSVASYVGARLGHEVVDRLVEPLLGGVYAGRADMLSLESTLPGVASLAASHRSLVLAVRGLRGSRSGGGGAMFAGLPGGVGRLPAAVAAASGAEVRTGTMVRELTRTPDGWRLVTGSAADPETVDADAVVLAVPAPTAARLLGTEVPAAAADLAAVEYASTAVVTLAYPTTSFPSSLAASGFLVPPVDRKVVKAATFSSRKWGWVADAAPGLEVVRLSVGRLGDERDLQRDDADLVAVAAADLAAATGVTGRPAASRVTRWGGALPQYAVGHRARVERVRAAVAERPGLAVCGAAYDGVGVAACVAGAERAADLVLPDLAVGGE